MTRVATLSDSHHWHCTSQSFWARQTDKAVGVDDVKGPSTESCDALRSVTPNKVATTRGTLSPTAITGTAVSQSFRATQTDKTVSVDDAKGPSTESCDTLRVVTRNKAATTRGTLFPTAITGTAVSQSFWRDNRRGIVHCPTQSATTTHSVLPSAANSDAAAVSLNPADSEFAGRGAGGEGMSTTVWWGCNEQITSGSWADCH